MPSSSTVASRATASTKGNFDKLSFVKYMKNIGGAYRKQAVELVSLCRTFVQAQEQSPESDNKLRIALKFVDDALSSAAEAKKKLSKEVDEKFATAIEELGCYEKLYHPRCHTKTVCERMASAKAKDKSTSTVLNVLKETCQKFIESEPTTVVEFLIFKSLPEKSPTIVRQVLGPNATLKEVLWNFSRFKGEKRLTLKQNPHFYKYSDLPTSQEAYVGKFRTEPIEDFQHPKICVLMDKPGRIFLETDKNTCTMRAFGNIWVPKDAIILKDVCGKLEGENVVQESIQDASDLWCLEESPISPTSLPASPSGPLSSVTVSSVNSVASGSFQDWREPICRGLITLETNICIRAVPPTHSSPSPSSPSSLPSRLQTPTRTPSRIHRSVRPTVVPMRSPVPRSSPIAPVPSSPNAVPRPQHPPMAAVPLPNQAVPASAASIAPTSNGVSQGGIAVRGESPKLLKRPDSGVSMSPLTVTFTSGIKGTAIIAADPVAADPQLRKRGMQLFQSSVWQFWNQISNKTS